jgi:hypothetical protein
MGARTKLARHAMALVALVSLCALPASAKPDNTAVVAECAVPAGIKTGDEVEVVIRLRALDNLQRLDVTVFGDRGVEVLSDVRELSVRDVARGAITELPVRVRMTAPKWGSLAVTYRTHSTAGPASGSRAFIFGDTK